MDKKKSPPHVAFVDRFDLIKLWRKCAERCANSFGTPSFPTELLIFENTIVNILNGEPLYDLVQKKKKEIDRDIDMKLELWIKKHPQESQFPAHIRDRHDVLTDEGDLKLFHFMLQLIEDKRFGTYKSEFDGEYETM